MISKDEIIRMAQTAWGDTDPSPDSVVWYENMEKFASLVAAHKQEQCAKVCEKEAELSVGSDADGCYGCAAAIRAMK